MEFRTAPSLNWLKSHLRDRDLTTSSGHIILGKSARGLHKVQSGERINIKFNGKTAVQCNISPSTNKLKNLTHTLYGVHQTLGSILPSFF